MNNQNKKNTGRFGLPLEIKYCSKCNISNQRPTTTNEYKHSKNTSQVTIEFDENNVCWACKVNAKKWDGNIDWKEREKELVEICNKYRNLPGQYNCLVGGSGGKDSVYQSHILKYKYGMRPLTVTWSPHMYTEIGWRNFQSWIHKGGFDNYLFTTNGIVNRHLTKRSLINLLHPFQPFILGQKAWPTKMAYMFDIPIIFYGESPSENGVKINNEKTFSKTGEDIHEGFVDDPIGATKIEDIMLGGEPIASHVDQGYDINEFKSYLPLEPEKIREKKIETHYLGYYLKWIPQENFYYAVDKTGFETAPERIDGTYQKHVSMDDKADNFHFYTYYIKFGMGRAMTESASDIRNGLITKEEGLGLIKQFDGGFPKKYEKDFLEYISMSREEFDELCDKFRPEHIWEKKSNRWEHKLPPWEYFEKN